MSDPLAIVVDTREKVPFRFGPDVVVQPGTLTSGDYSIAGLDDHVAIERKSLPDLVACVGRERDRFKRELHRLRGYRCRAVVIEAAVSDVLAHNYRSAVHPNAVLGSVASWQVRYEVPFGWAGEHGAEIALGLMRAYWKQLQEIMNTVRERQTV